MTTNASETPEDPSSSQDGDASSGDSVTGGATADTGQGGSAIWSTIFGIFFKILIVLLIIGAVGAAVVFFITSNKKEGRKMDRLKEMEARVEGR